MSKTTKTPKKAQKEHFATPQNATGEVLDGVVDITHVPNEGRKHGKIDKEVFMRALEKGMPQDQAFILAGGVASNSSVARSSASKLKSVILGADSNTKYNFLERLQATRNKILEKISDEDIDKASLKDKTISLGIMIEKTQLLSGQPTENVANLHLHVKANYMALDDDDLETRLLESG